MIGDGKLLTNAHCVEHDTQVYFPSWTSFSYYSLLILFTLITYLLIRLKLREGEMIESMWLRFVLHLRLLLLL